MSNPASAQIYGVPAAHDSMALAVRQAQPGDVAAIDVVTQAAFARAPHSRQTEHHIVRALRAAGALTLSLVALRDDVLIGHVAASPVVLSGGQTGWFGIGPLSVAPAHQRQGAGMQLMRAALRALRGQGAAGAVLLGDPAYYARFGFAPRPGLVLPGVPAEYAKYFQTLAFVGEVPRGVVRFHPAFEAAA